MSFDPVALEVLWTRLISIVDEAAAALVRTSFSTLVRESHDFSVVLTDRHGRSLAQATRSIPSFIGTLPRTVRHMLDAYPAETLHPDDILITNDLWLGTGHLPDITVARPIFREGAVVGFAASTAHAPDIGGKIRSAEPREVFEEGLQIPIMKLVDAGREDTTLVRLIRKNVRVPDLVMGDLNAQITALALMTERIGAMMTTHGLDTLDALAETIQARSERVTREAIAALPDGTVRAALDTDGLDVPVHLEMALTVDGSEISIDLAGSSDQVDRAINVALCYTIAYTSYGVKCAVAPDVPNNEGCFAPITITAPEGSIVNARFPAAGGCRLLVGHYLPVLVFQALGSLIPERVMAASGSPLWGIQQSGIGKDGRPQANMLFFNGGMGANARGDGASTLSWPSNVSSTPVEIIEQVSPFRVHHKRLREGSGGPGRHRGGLGQEVRLESRSPGTIAVAFLAERTRFPAAGLNGGEAGAPGIVEVDGARVDPKEIAVLRQGAVIDLATPGGGGFGDPSDRDADAAARDADHGLVHPPSPARHEA